MELIKRYKVLAAILAVVVAVGVGCWVYQLIFGLTVTGMNNGTSWGLYITNFMFFVGLSAGGLIVASSASVFHITKFKACLLYTSGKQVDLRQGPGAVLEAPIAGIMAAAEVVAFVFIVGGAFQIITATGAIDAGMRRVVRRFKSKDILVIPIAMLLFALGGSTFGMAEETLPFFAIFLPIMIAMGFDSLTAFMIVFIGAKAGYIASTVNPFSVLIAQGVIGITGNPQLWLRAIMFVVIVGLSIGWVVLYARKVRKNPELSLTFHDDKQKRLDMGAVDDDVPFTTAQKWILVVFLAGMALIVWGLVSQGWYMSELSAVFLAMGLLAGIIARFSHCLLYTSLCRRRVR